VADANGDASANNENNTNERIEQDILASQSHVSVKPMAARR